MTGLRSRIEDFYTAYNIALDDLDLERWVEMFDDPCDYRIVPRENWEADLPLSTMHCESKGMLVDRVKGIRQTMMFAPRYCRRFISSIQVEEQNKNIAKVRSNFLCVQTLVDQPSEVAFCGLANDTLVFGIEKVLLRQRTCILDTEMIPNSLIYPL